MSATTPSRSWAAARPTLPRATVVDAGPAPFVLALGAATLLVVLHLRTPGLFPLMAFVPFCLVVTVFLPSRLAGLVLGYVGLWVLALAIFAPQTQAYSAIVLLASMTLLLAVARSRAHHGVRTFEGDRMLTDLRDRLFRMGDIPPLPVGWRAERAFASAHGQAFAGDFNVTVLDRDNDRLEMILTDVSGKGQRAGTRALVLGGVMSGLLGSAPSDQVLPMTNSFLDRERWDEGFATAVQVSVDLATGEAVVTSAGHPAAVHHDAGSGRWSPVAGGRGPALGVVAEAVFPETRLSLGHGDALLVCTDGVIESRGRTLDDGIDWMLGTAEASLVHGLPGLADHLVRNGRAGVEDDRAAVIIWRE